MDFSSSHEAAAVAFHVVSHDEEASQVIRALQMSDSATPLAEPKQLTPEEAFNLAFGEEDEDEYLDESAYLAKPPATSSTTGVCLNGHRQLHSISCDSAPSTGSFGDDDQQTSALEVLGLRHPWGSMDYCEYLRWAESGRQETGVANMMLFNGQATMLITFEDYISDTIESAAYGEEPLLIFQILPVSEDNVSFSGARYCLGLNTSTSCFFARWFDASAISDNDEISAELWSLGRDIYSFSDDDMIKLLVNSTSNDPRNVVVPRLSKTKFCRFPECEEDLGSGMTILLLCAQWWLDFSAALPENDEECTRMLSSVVQQWRDVLEKLSQDTLLAHRMGISYEWYAMLNRAANDDHPMHNIYDAVDECVFNMAKLDFQTNAGGTGVSEKRVVVRPRPFLGCFTHGSTRTRQEQLEQLRDCFFVGPDNAQAPKLTSIHDVVPGLATLAPILETRQTTPIPAPKLAPEHNIDCKSDIPPMRIGPAKYEVGTAVTYETVNAKDISYEPIDPFRLRRREMRSKGRGQMPTFKRDGSPGAPTSLRIPKQSAGIVPKIDEVTEQASDDSFNPIHGNENAVSGHLRTSLSDPFTDHGDASEHDPGTSRIGSTESGRQHHPRPALAQLLNGSLSLGSPAHIPNELRRDVLGAMFRRPSAATFSPSNRHQTNLSDASTALGSDHDSGSHIEPESTLGLVQQIQQEVAARPELDRTIHRKRLQDILRELRIANELEAAAAVEDVLDATTETEIPVKKGWMRRLVRSLLPEAWLRS